MEVEVKYICVSDLEERALFYIPSIGRKRIYRGCLNSRPANWKLFEYKSVKKAMRLCERVNVAYNDNFYPKELINN